MRALVAHLEAAATESPSFICKRFEAPSHVYQSIIQKHRATPDDCHTTLGEGATTKLGIPFSGLLSFFWFPSFLDFVFPCSLILIQSVAPFGLLLSFLLLEVGGLAPVSFFFRPL